MSTSTRTGGRRSEPERHSYGVAPFPGPGASPTDRDENEWWLEREIGLLQRALDDKGEMRRRDLGNLVGCKYWGPGRFSAAQGRRQARSHRAHRLRPLRAGAASRRGSAGVRPRQFVT
jgi:hypothetical protein